MTDDLIGRAEAQTAIQFAAKRYTVAHEAHGEGQVVWSDNLINVTDAMNVLRDLPSAQSEQQWVPCSERLPDKMGDYLVTLWDDRGTWVEIALWNETFGGRWQAVLYNDVDYSDISNVIAWLPLPEPYQGER